MQNQVVEQRILEAMAKQEPKQPRVIELGGGYYYKCFYMSCDADLSKWMNYCPKCGCRIDWKEIE
jgi:hypothetical protein